MKAKQFFGFVLILCMISGFGYAQDVGHMAPDFTYTDLQGDRHSLSDYDGKVRVLFTLGNRCTSCLAIGNAIETDINQAFNSNLDFQMLGLDFWDATSSLATMRDFKQRTGITFPLLLQAGSAGSLYGISYDRLIVIDQQGIIQFKGTSLAANDMDSAIVVIQSLFSQTGVANNPGAPAQFALDQNYPNPFNNATVIRFSVPEADYISLKLYNLTGNELLTVAEGYYEAGNHEMPLLMENLPGGAYFYRLTRGNEVRTRRLIYLK